MPAQTVSLELPEKLYNDLKRRADHAHRPVEAELLDVLTDAIQQTEEPARDLTAVLASLALLPDEALWQSARFHLPDDTAAKLEALNLQQQDTGLSAVENQLRGRLLHEYERAMLIRAEAAALLKERGHDVSVLRTPR